MWPEGLGCVAVGKVEATLIVGLYRLQLPLAGAGKAVAGAGLQVAKPGKAERHAASDGALAGMIGQFAEPETLAPLIRQLHGETSILVGQSGVGKSSLVKALIPDIDVQIGHLSEATGLGRHTTSAARCYQLPEGGDIIDSPGVRSFRLGPISISDLERGFREFRPFLGRCRFADCRHDREPDCALQQAVLRGRIRSERLQSFRHLAEQLSD